MEGAQRHVAEARRALREAEGLLGNHRRGWLDRPIAGERTVEEQARSPVAQAARVEVAVGQLGDGDVGGMCNRLGQRVAAPVSSFVVAQLARLNAVLAAVEADLFLGIDSLGQQGRGGDDLEHRGRREEVLLVEAVRDGSRILALDRRQHPPARWLDGHELSQGYVVGVDEALDRLLQLWVEAQGRSLALIVEILESAGSRIEGCASQESVQSGRATR